MTGWPRFRSVALGVVWRNLHNYFTNPALVLPGLLFPLFFFTAFAGGLSRVADVPGFEFAANYTAFQFVFVLLQSAAFGGVFNGFSVARDFETGFSRRLFLAAPNRVGVLVGYGISALCRWGFTAAVLTGVAFATGMDIGGPGADLIGVYGLAVLVNIAASLFAAGVAMRARTIQAGPAMQIPVFLLLFFAPVYVPLDLLSGWIHAVAVANPITYVLEAGRGLIGGDPVYVGLAFGIGFALIAAFVVWAMRGLRNAEAAG
jgi:ABC-2 type transport system permease protein